MATQVTQAARALLACCLIAGCASYRKLPLPERAPLAGSVADLSHDGIDVSRPLDVADIARLALRNDPDLRAAADRHAVARGVVLGAGLLPDPQVSLYATPVTAGPGIATAFGGSLAVDIHALITRPVRLRQARAAAGQIDATLLWQAWQVVGQARLLAVQLIYGARSQALLERAQDVLDARAARGEAAIARGNATILTVAPDIAAANTLRARRDALQRLLATQTHALDALLGLAPDAPLDLARRADLPEQTPQEIDGALQGLADRPDLAALRFGYRSQDAALRLAILSQFPTLTLLPTFDSDTGNVKTLGPTANFTLPLFNRNQGAIAVARATRRQLRDEYAARLAAAHGQIRALLAERRTLSAQLARLRREIPQADRMAAQAQSAFAAGNLGEQSYAELAVTAIDKRQEAIAVQQSLDGLRVALDTLTGADMPRINFDGGRA